ncbi:unnamed protein product, partial [Meganyctiphanes norvegica]
MYWFRWYVWVVTVMSLTGQLLLVVTGVSGYNSRVRVAQGGGYRGVVMAIHPNYRPTNCTAFIDNLKGAIASWSHYLWRATEAQLYVSGVDVVVPPQLARFCHLSNLRQATWQRWASADFLVKEGDIPPSMNNRGKNTMRGEWLWGPEGSAGVGVHQPQGCGQPGHHISIHPQELSHATNYEVLGRSLTASWARYRWGVFEERGYGGHPQFPASHMQDAEPTPTSCTPIALKGVWIDQEM